MKYKSDRIIDGKLRRVIVEVTETGKKIVNRNPTKEELIGLEEEPYVMKRRSYTDVQLLEYLKQFFEKNGRPPVWTDFKNDHKYPDPNIYRRYFGSWNNALKMVGLGMDAMVKQGILLNRCYNGRLFEIIIRDHFENISIDLSGENFLSPCDGICPNGKTYEVKSSKFYNIDKCWNFGTRNRYKEEIEYYYFGAFSEDWSKLMYVWRVPGEIVEKDYFIVNMYGGKFNTTSMKEYDITDKFKDVFNGSMNCNI